jgi:hypothetical protein
MKPFKTHTGIFAGSALFLIFLFMQACATAPAKGIPKVQNPWKEMNLVLVLPFQNMTAIYGEGEHVKSPLGDQYYLAGKIEPDGVDYMNGKLMDLLEKRKGLRTISPQGLDTESKGAANSFPADFQSLQRLTEMAKAAGTDGVLIGYVYKFSERVGNSMSVSSPASVAFELFLVSAKYPSVVWSACFSETQKSLSEDLTQIKKYFQRGVKWITAEEMAGAALTSQIEEIPER